MVVVVGGPTNSALASAVAQRSHATLIRTALEEERIIMGDTELSLSLIKEFGDEAEHESS